VDHVSALLTSSYAQSTVSSDFTLSTKGSSTSSTLTSNFTLSTKGSSTSSALVQDKSKTLSASLKRLYRELSLLEAKVSREDGDEALDEPMLTLDGEGKKEEDTEKAEKVRWKRLLDDHKK